MTVPQPSAKLANPKFSLNLLLSFFALTATFLAQAQVRVLTHHNDNARTGQNLNESTLTPANVNSTTFGRLFTIPVDGKVDAEPLYVGGLSIPNNGIHNTLFVATEHDSVYAFDADSATQLWKSSMLKSGETTSGNLGCVDVTPEIGVTSTPVIDLASGLHGTIYVVAMSVDSSSSYHQRLHALDITSGAEQFGGPVDITGSFSAHNSTVTFDPAKYKARPGLLLLNGLIYIAFSSHCDSLPYTGWLLAYNESTLAQSTIFNIEPNGTQASFWASGSGLAADAAGNIYAISGNGTFDTTLDANLFPSLGDFGNAFIKFSTASNHLAVADYFTMFNTVSESDGDTDFGSGGVLLLPDMRDAGNNLKQLAVGAGKDKNIYLVDRNNLGKFNLSDNNNIYQELPNGLGGRGSFGMAAYFNNSIYYGAAGDYMRQFTFTNARLNATPASMTTFGFTYPGTTPSVSANGTGSGIVWAAENSSSPNPAVLHALNPANLATEYYNSNQAANLRDFFGFGNKFVTPMIANGKVYVGTTTGVGVFGLLGAPSALYLNPNSGGGLNQTFTTVYTDPNGAADIQVTYFDVGGQGSQLSCFVAYVQSSNALYLFKDDNSGVLGPITPGTANTVSNNQCTLSGAAGAASTSGRTLTLPLSISFKAGFARPRGVYALAQNYNGVHSGWQFVGMWTPAPAAVSAVAVAPNSGGGAGPQTFTAIYSDPSGASDLQVAYLDFGLSPYTSGSCIAAYVPASNALYLLNDNPGSGAMGPIMAGTNSTLTNTQCALSGSGGLASSAGNNLTAPFSITFNAGFTGATNIWGAAQNYSGVLSAWTMLGTWTPTAAPFAPLSVSPNPSNGTSPQIFRPMYSDPNGALDLQVVYLDFGASPFASGSCIAAYVSANNTLYLFNDNPSTGALGPLTAGTNSTLSNTQCTLSGSGGLASARGNDLTAPFSITFKAGFTGSQKIWGLAQKYSGAQSAWTMLGTWAP